MKVKLRIKDWAYMTICCAGGAIVGGYFGAMTGEFYSGIEITDSTKYDLTYVGMITAGILGVLAGIVFSKKIRCLQGGAARSYLIRGMLIGCVCGVMCALLTHIILFIIRCSLVNFDSEELFIFLIAVLIGGWVGSISGFAAGFILSLEALVLGYHRQSKPIITEVDTLPETGSLNVN